MALPAISTGCIADISLSAGYIAQLGDIIEELAFSAGVELPVAEYAHVYAFDEVTFVTKVPRVNKIESNLLLNGKAANSRMEITLVSLGSI